MSPPGIEGEDRVPVADEPAESLDPRALAGVFIFAFAVRATAMLELADSPLSEVLLGDARGYVEWGREIAAGNWRGDDVFYQAPLYPYFLGALFTIAGSSVETIRVAQLFLGSASCLLIALAGARFFGARAGLAAGGLLALYPMAIFFDAIVQKTSLALFLFALLLLAISRFDRVEEIRWPLLGGATLALLVLTRENALILFPCLALWCCVPWSGGVGAQRATRLALFVAGATVILVPIGARNLALGDAFLITTSQLGPNLFIGNNPNADGRYRALLPNRGDVRHERRDAQRLAERASGRRLTPQEVSDFWVARVFKYAADQPVAFAKLLGHKFYMVLNAEEIADTESVEAYADESIVLAVLVRIFHFGVLFPLGVLGLVLTRKRFRALLPLYLFGGALILGVAGFFVMARYRFPLVPLLAMFAGAGLVGAGAWIRKGERATVAQGVVPFVAAATLSNLPLGVAQEPRATTHYNVAVAMLEQDRLADAQIYLERASAVSQEAIVHLELGRVLERRRAFDAAARHYEALLEARRADPAELHLRLARVYRALGREAEALQHDAGSSR